MAAVFLASSGNAGVIKFWAPHGFGSPPAPFPRDIGAPVVNLGPPFPPGNIMDNIVHVYYIIHGNIKQSPTGLSLR